MKTWRRSAVVVLAGIERRRLLRHPAASLALLSPILMLAAATAPDDDFLAYKLLIGAGFLPAATAGLLASWAAMSRSRRDDTDELSASMPDTNVNRDQAHLLGVATPTAGAALLVAVAVMALTSWRGLPTPVLPGGFRASAVAELIPAWFGLLQGPALVAAACAVGVSGQLLAWTTA